MDFYETIKPKIEKAVRVFAEQFSDCKKKLAKTESRLQDEKALLARLQEQKEKLTGLADDTLAGCGDNDYEKFKVSLKKVNAQIEATFEAAETLETKIIPAQQKEVAAAKQKLTSELSVFCRRHRDDCEQKMTELLDEVVGLQDDFFDAFNLLYADFGLEIGVAFRHDPMVLHPLPNHARIEDLSIRGRTAGQRAATMKAPTTPEITPTQPQDEPKPPGKTILTGITEETAVVQQG